ncbi:hypothetical protein ABPG72_022509 [Tetrahymena utriculariae]
MIEQDIINNITTEELFCQIKQIEDDCFHQNTCKYRKEINQQSEISLKLSQDQYRDYIKNFPNQIKKHISVAKIKYINQYERLGKFSTVEVVTSILCEQSGINHQENQQIFQFFQNNKHNLFKNILSAFKRHINECEDTLLMSVYENLSEDKWTFSHIQQRVSANLAKCGRFNLKIKNLSKNKNLHKIFNYFLKNSQKLWLKNSKIYNKKQYSEQIELIIKAQDRQFLQNFTQCYKKQRKNSMEN